MEIEGPLLAGRFVERPNRFLTRVEIDGRVIDSHLPDPGRLRELLVPGVEVFLRPVAPESLRKTRYTTVMVKKGHVLISLVSALPNRFVAGELSKRQLPMLADLKLVRAEVPVGRHRFDFLLRDNAGGDFYLEVKSVTYVENGIARFPDAVSERASRHALALADLIKEGQGAGILFVCQRPDATVFSPMEDRDPKFAQSLYRAWRGGVRVWCIATKVTLEKMTYWREIPIMLNGQIIA